MPGEQPALLQVEVGLVQGRQPSEPKMIGVVVVSSDQGVGSRFFQVEDTAVLRHWGMESMAFLELQWLS